MSSCHVCVCIMAPPGPLHHLLDVNIASLCQRCHSPILPFNFAYLPSYLSRYQDVALLQHQNGVKMVTSCEPISASEDLIFPMVFYFPFEYLVLMNTGTNVGTNKDQTDGKYSIKCYHNNIWRWHNIYINTLHIADVISLSYYLSWKSIALQL